MAGNSFGTLFKITTFGESHGGAVGVVIDGVPPNLELDEQDIQKELDRRKPGQNFITTPRQESDRVHILSGIFEGKTTGTPLLLLLYNTDARPEAYNDIKDKFRPGHADYTFFKKFGIRDYRGSGRASGRETAARVAAGAVAKKLLSQRGVHIVAYTLRAAGIQCQKRDESVIEQNPLRACDLEAAAAMVQRLQQLQEEQDSAGGIIECRVRGLPVGLGEPVFDKLDALLAHAMLSLGAVKGIEFGDGFAGVDLRGSEHNDWMDAAGFRSNHAGGVLGGISTGAELVFRIAVKPVSSIAKPQQTITIDGKETEIRTEGRHDTCILPRLVPVVEAMTALVLEDLWKLQESLRI
ncbi:MAG TPA: chorismate synthase [Termitinemataceae bacterium]|nr:chorismate synthase [Termitinemataceae bacterium]HOM23252.1 chorismate synthase [Termitinemataceae bacterium]HPQ00200.1 chorismate synthase [Termitinemataceae bacterium]